MEIIKKVKESDSIVIEGGKKIGKITLALYFSKLMNSKITLISSLVSSKIVKKIRASIYSFDCFKDLNKFLTIFSFREDWINLKNEYGYKYLLKDLEYLISEQKSSIIIFHKIGSFFDYADRDFIEEFILELLSYGITYKKKFIFTLNIDDTNYDILGHCLVDNCDLYLKLYKKEYRYIDVLYSLTTISQTEYIFNNDGKKLILKPKSSYITNNNISILVIAENHYLQRLHKYLLEKEGIELNIVSDILTLLDAILTNPDYLIFTQNSEKMRLSICELAKKHKLQTQILYVLNRDFIRVDDRMKAKELGCVDMVKLDENIMNYVLELEKYLNLVFYKKVDAEHETRFDDKNKFKNYIQKALKKRLIFTIVKIKDVLDEKDCSLIRKYDKILVTDKYRILFMLNTLKTNAEHILKRNFNKKFNIEKIQDSLDIFFGEELCID
jgi:hypothetical protein